MASAALGGTSAMNNDQFMMVLLAQMRNQNPLEPMDDKEIIAQMAQLNSLEELQQINATLRMMLGAFIQAGQQDQDSAPQDGNQVGALRMA
jgi:flagellar hook assembly protein FlgD